MDDFNSIGSCEKKQLTIEDFNSIELGTSFSEIETKFGEADDSCSGFLCSKYKLSDSTI